MSGATPRATVRRGGICLSSSKSTRNKRSWPLQLVTCQQTQTHTQEWKATTAVLVIGSLGRMVTALPHHLPDAETRRNAGRAVAESTKAGGDRALEALKRTVRRTAIASYTSGGPARRRHQAAQGTAVDSGVSSMARSDQGKASRKGSLIGVADEELGEGTENVPEAESPWGPFVGVGPKAGETLDMEQRWAMTEQFYERMTLAAERLEAKRTAEKG